MKTTILISLIILFIFSGCSRNDNTSKDKTSRIDLKSEKDKYYGVYENNKANKTILKLYDNAYFTDLTDSTEMSCSYDIDGKVIRFFNPEYTYNSSTAKKFKEFKENGVEPKYMVRFYDIIDTATFRGITEEFKKVSN